MTRIQLKKPLPSVGDRRNRNFCPGIILVMTGKNQQK